MEKIFLKLVGAFINTTAILFPRWNSKNSFRILGKVYRSNITEKGKVFFGKAEQTYFELDGQSSVLHKWGHGSKNVLFLHGWMSNSQRWLPYQDKLDLQEYTMYALDAPGHGMSKTNFLNLEMYRQAINSAIQTIGDINTVVCHSFSNTAFTYLYLDNPSIPVRKIAIMGAPSGMDAIFDYFNVRLSLSNKAVSILDKRVNKLFKIPHQEILIENLLKLAPQEKLVVHEKKDTITPFAPIEKALKNNPEVDSLITNGLKHDLKSEEVYGRIISFVNK